MSCSLLLQPPQPQTLDQAKAPPPEAAAGHDGRLKYARPQDLPSFPSLGLREGDAAASAAASLGWASSKPVSLWSPASDTNAHKAATLAKDYKMPAAWQPHPSPAGSKTAAVLAAENATRGDRQSSSSSALPASAWGNSAANQAFAAGRNSPRDSTATSNMATLDRQKSLRAARGAMAGSTRPRSTSTPMTYPDSANAATNALSAATIAHRPSAAAPAPVGDAGASPITKLDRQMYTSNPPVKPEVDDRNREAVLHASAVAMAKKMYSTQQKAFDAATHGNDQGGGSRPGSADSDLVRPMHFNNLQEAAYRLAQERLAKLHDEHQRNRGYQDYYGAGTSPPSPGRKFTKLGKARRRSSSDSDVARPGTDDDRKRSRQIHKQMSLFSTRLSEVDESQRAKDRDALLAAAQRNVKAAMEGMDEKVSRDTGRVHSSKLSEWELRAHATAQARSDERKGGGVAAGKVDLGGGQYMDREKVEQIAAKRVQPLLDEINEKAEIERKRIVAMREEQEKKRLEWEAEKARNAEVKENQRKLKDEEKARRGELRQEAKARKEEEKAAKAEEKRLAREESEKRKPAAVAVASGEHVSEAPLGPADQPTEESTSHRHRILPFTPRIQTKSTSASNAKGEPSPLSPSSNTSPESANESPTSRVKNWLKSRLHKPRAKSVSGNNASGGGRSSDAGGGRAPGGFLGGHRLKRLHPDGTGSMTSLSEERSASMREVALAGRTNAPVAVSDEPGESSGSKSAAPASAPASAPAAAAAGTTADHGRIGGSASSDDGGGDDGLAGRSQTNRSSGAPELEGITPPRALLDPAGAGTGVTPRSSVGSGNRDSKFIENID
ncbi:Eisosome assembly protein [Diaporthe eres]|uniref:Eisosome assembly protein n=1 Tax=Diaporthe eres TaxID=83184 RepID=A0ABR1NZT4_DIAER